MIVALFFIAALVSRVPFLEKYHSYWDGPDYSIAIVRYSFEQHTPTAPGYPLYIALGKFFYFFIHDLHGAILAVSVLGSCLGAIILYLVGKRMYNRHVGIAAASIFLSGPAFYYFGLTPHAYGLLPGTTALLAYSVYRIFIMRKQEGLFFGLIYGICFGFRPQETLQIGPLALLGFLFLNLKQKIYAVLIFVSITISWLLPVAYANGGIKKFFEFYFEATGGITSHQPWKEKIEIIIKGLFLSLGISNIFLLSYLKKFAKFKLKSNRKIIIFFTIWIIPGFFFNFFLRTDHAGYQMSYLTGVLLLISYALWLISRKSKVRYIFLLSVVVAFNLYWFFRDRDPNLSKPYIPISFHYSEIKKNDLKLGSKISFIQQKFDPKKTLIITTPDLSRPYMYYLKKYHLMDLGALNTYDQKNMIVKRDTKDWTTKITFNKSLLITVPENITTIVFPDDQAKNWVKNYPFKTYQLPGNSTITTINVSPKTTIRYGYDVVEVLQ